MEASMVTAGVLALVVGAVHSVLGEILIFQHLRVRGLVPTLAAPPLRERHVRILWATWHFATALGWAFGLALFRAVSPNSAAALAFLGGSLLVLVGTRGRHPGWIGCLAVAALAWLG